VGDQTGADHGTAVGSPASVGTSSAAPTQTRSENNPGQPTQPAARTGAARGAVANDIGPTAGGVRSPVRIASVGTYSGPIGAILVANVEGLRVWVRWINGRGGLNGHPVTLAVADDGGDPARHRAQVQDMVERIKVIAFVQNSESLAGPGSVDYLTAKRVPVVGGDTAGQYYYSSP